MTEKIDHPFLDLYEAAKGEPERVSSSVTVDLALWEVVDELMLDLHLERHGYADAAYGRHIERELTLRCTGPSVVQRMRDMRL